METYHKNRLLFWVLVFLVIVNLAALGTYFFFPRQQTVVTCEEGAATPGCVYQSRLDLTDEQARQVDLISEDYLKLSRPIADEIKGIRGQILDELTVDQPDTSYLNELSSALAELQGQLQRKNIEHYLELKEVCNPEQAMRLSNLYRELYGCPMQQQGRGIQHKHRK